MEDSRSEQQRMLRRHQREKKELQDHIQLMRSSVPKSDKKKRKQLHLDVARLEAEMEQKHQQELEKFLDSVTEDLAKMDLENQSPHLLRARRKQERRVALLRARQGRTAEVNMECLASFRQSEAEKLGAILEAKHLEMKDMPTDSHCMYRAIQDQLVFSVTVESLRSRTAKYMRKHIDDFLPFFSDPETGDAYSRNRFFRCCDNIVCSASWGGQLELRALSHILQTRIEVMQADPPAIVIGEEYTRKPLILVYAHYTCNFGEHCNSAKPQEAGATGGAAPRLF
nr:OTU domain-containing protein 6A-like [Odocoileus virginianus texanus]